MGIGSWSILHGLIQSARWKAYALAPRRVDEPVVLVDPMRIKARSKRAAAWLAIVEHTQCPVAADRIEPQLAWQRGQLALARGAFVRGDLRGALSRLRRLRHPRIVAERQLLIAELRLALRDTEYMGRTPCVRDPIVGARVQLLLAVALTRAGLRANDPCCLARANGHLVDARLDAALRREFLAMLARSRVEIPRALIALRTAPRGGVIDAVLAEYVSQQHAPVLVADTPPTEPLARALYDEAVSLSPRANERRRVLITAAQATLRRSDDPVILAARLRTLVHLGGTLAANAIQAFLDRLGGDMSGSRLGELAREALCLVDPRGGARHAIAQLDDRALQLAELRGGVPRGFAHAVRRAINAHGRDWVSELLAHWAQLPEPHVLENIAARPVVPSPRALLDDVLAASRVLATDAHDRVAKKIAADPDAIDALLLAHPARVTLPWSRLRWLELFATLAKRETFVEHDTLVECARRLGLPHYAPLRLGRLPGVSTITPVADGLRLRLLDKRFDLPTYLRFADITARSCFRSDCSMYRRTTQEALLDVWQDPLSFCFHVERGSVPCGFIFGSFVLVDDRIGAAFSSLHLRPASARLAVFGALESALAPLGLELGFANMFGGFGVMPATYKQRERWVRRLRALGTGDTLVTTAYDDVSFLANQRERVDHLWWRA